MKKSGESTEAALLSARSQMISSIIIRELKEIGARAEVKNTPTYPLSDLVSSSHKAQEESKSSETE